MKTKITPFNTDVAKWYTDIVGQAELVIYGPVKGTIFIRPYGFKIWTLIKDNLTTIFNSENIEEVSFPSLIPKSLLTKEEDHLEGFAPELFEVTRIGNKELNENLILRPTSEVLFNEYFRQTLTSYNQLPIMLNQWANIVRYENNTRPFLRNTEFLWQEGHTLHLTPNEADIFAKKMINVYKSFANDFLCLDVFMGFKSASERFAGAEDTWTIETVLKDGKFLQSGTSHNLSNNFTKPFDVKFQNSDNKITNPFETSWGVSTRLIGAVIMTHSDDNGLRLPSKISPYQIVILTVNNDESIIESSNKIFDKLKNDFRIFTDCSDKGIGFKSQNWETKGIPIRIEIGPRDIAENKVIVVRRDNNTKVSFDIDKLTIESLNKELRNYDDNLLLDSKNIKDSKEVFVSTIEELEDVVSKDNYAKCYWSNDSELEEEIKNKTSASIRLLQKVDKLDKAINSNDKVDVIAIFAKSY